MNFVNDAPIHLYIFMLGCLITLVERPNCFGLKLGQNIYYISDGNRYVSKNERLLLELFKYENIVAD